MAVKIKECFKELTDPNIPQIIYIDSSIFLEAFTKNARYQRVCFTFLENVIKINPVVVYSYILVSELWCSSIKIKIREKYGQNVNTTEIAKKNPKLLKEYFHKSLKMEDNFNLFLSKIKEIVPIEITKKIIDKARLIMPKYRLGSADAIHIATAEEWDIHDIACLDRDWLYIAHYNPSFRIWCINGYKKFMKRYRISYKEEKL